MAFAVEREWVGRCAVISVHGDIDALTAPQLSSSIADVAGELPAAVIVDLTDVQFLSSSGITALVSGNEQLVIKAATKASFAVVADGPSTSRPLKMMAIDSIFPMYSTLQEAQDAAAQV